MNLDKLKNKKTKLGYWSNEKKALFKIKKTTHTHTHTPPFLLSLPDGGPHARTPIKGFLCKSWFSFICSLYYNTTPMHTQTRQNKRLPGSLLYLLKNTHGCFLFGKQKENFFKKKRLKRE